MSVAERISHLELDCTDLGKSVDFYTRAVGLELLSEVPGVQATLRAPSGQLLVLEQCEGIVPKGVAVTRHAEGPHYAFFVDPRQWHALLRQLDACGVPWNDRAHATARPRGEAGAYFSDPDGYTVQFITAGLEA